MLFAGGKRLAYEEEIPFRNLIVFDKGIPVHKDIPIELSPTTEPLSLKVKANAAWQSLIPLVSVIEDHWYTYSFYAKISNMPGGVFFYTNTDQWGIQPNIVDTSSWKLQVNGTRISALREPNGFDLTNFIRQNNLQNTEMKISVTFRVSKAGQTGFALESDSSGFEFYAGLWNFKETPWCSAYEDYVMKSDKALTTKTLIQALFSDELVNIVDDSFDMNNARPGIYRSWGKKPINTPNDCVAWAKYFAVPFVEGDSNSMFQIAIDTNGNMFTRAKGGDPATWLSWHRVNLGE